MTTAIQRSFAGGEVAPALYGRADQAKYATGLRTCRNFLVQRYGGVTNRPGTKFVAEVKDSTRTVRLLPFVYNNDQTYVLEFGNLYMRVIRQGVRLESPPGTPYEIVTPYAEADLLGLKFVQSADVVTIVHPNYPPQKLSRTGHTSWTITALSLVPSISAPSPCSVTKGGAGGNSFRYRVTAIKSETLEESYAATETAKAITGATQANPCKLTAAAHGYSTGDEVTIAGVVGMTQLNGKTTTITVTGVNDFTLDGIDSTAFTAYSSGGTVARTYCRCDSAATPTSANPNVITWTAVSGAQEYNIYKELNGRFGFCGIANGTSFNDIGYIPDTTDAPAVPRTLFEAATKYPGAVAYVNERLIFGGSDAAPETVWTSRPGWYTNFSTSSPPQDDDAVTFTLAGRQVNRVKHLLDLKGLVILTTGSELVAKGDNGVLKPTAIGLETQGYSGSADLAPIIITNSALFVQARGSVVRDLRYEFSQDGWQGRDLSIFAPHLIDAYQLVDWTYAQIPHSVIWAIRSDGTMLGLTYVREHEVAGWHRHDTAGDAYERACSVPESDEDALYTVVRRTINGATKRYIERMASRRITTLATDAFFVDCGITYNGANTGGTTLTLSGGTTWTNTEDLTLTASAAQFIAGDVGNDYVLTIGGVSLPCRVLAYTDTTHVTVRAGANVPVSHRGVATASWSLAKLTITGLSHLEGRTVACLADGNVTPRLTVTAGSVTLPRPASIAHIGLPIQADLETLDMESVQAETLIDKPKLLGAATLLVEGSRGVWAGQDLTHLREYKQRSTEPWDTAIAPFTGPVEIAFDAAWGRSGRLAIRQDDPLPLTVLAIAPRGTVGG